MVLLAELGQALIALGFSGAVALWLGPTAYIVTAVCVFVVCALLMYERSREMDGQLQLPGAGNHLVIGQLMIMLAALLFGACWPALPLILAYGAWKRRRSAGSKNAA